MQAIPALVCPLGHQPLLHSHGLGQLFASATSPLTCLVLGGAHSLGDRVEQEPPLVAAVVVRRQLERRVAVERVGRLLFLTYLTTEVGGRAHLLPGGLHAEELEPADVPAGLERLGALRSCAMSTLVLAADELAVVLVRLERGARRIGEGRRRRSKNFRDGRLLNLEMSHLPGPMSPPVLEMSYLPSRTRFLSPHTLLYCNMALHVSSS
jgi:hypothetical protein